MTDPLKPGLYRHYQGGIYLLIGTALFEGTGQVLVVYAKATARDVLLINSFWWFASDVMVLGVLEPVFKGFSYDDDEEEDGYRNTRLSDGDTEC